jgi:GT2 family glycosyltransferase
MPEGEAAKVVVIVPTRRRTDALRRCLASIRDGNGDDIRITVVDQDPQHSAAGVCAELGSRFVEYLPHGTGGKSAALNIGIATTESAFVAFTDDDCTVPEGWIERGLAAFGDDPRLGIVFGGAIAREHDSHEEFVPSYVPPRRELRRGRNAAAKIGALGGNMFVRRSAIEAVGGFDEALGPGAPLPSAEDQDLNNRVLRAGFSVLADPGLLVVHHGGRPYADGAVKALQRGYSTGIGALAVKDLRRGALGGLYPVVRELGAEARALVRRGDGPFVLRSPWLLRGMWRGLRTPIDSETGRFTSKR